MVTRGRASARVKKAEADETKLGRYCWTKVGGSGKMTYFMTVYMPHNRERDTTKGGTVWDQQKIHYESEGLLEKEPCQALMEDVIEKLLEWKRDDCEIVLTGDFNQDVYKGELSKRLAEEDINMTEQVLKTTGEEIPPTHDRGRKAVCGVFATAGVECKAAEVLLRGSGMGDHLVFMLDFCTRSVLGDNCPRVVAAPGRKLRCDVYAYKKNHNKTLEQLVARHSMYTKLAGIMSLPDTAAEEYDVKMNKWDDELREFMISAENKCRTFKNDDLEWSPTVKLWIKRRWILGRLQKFIAKKRARSLSTYKRLKRSCRRNGLKEPHLFTRDELNIEMKTCV